MSHDTSTTSLFHDTLNGLSDWVFLMDPDGSITWSNQAFRDFFGRGPSDSVCSLEGVLPGIATELFADFREMVDSGDSRSGIWRALESADGTRAVIRFHAIPHKSQNGTLAGLIVYGRDITDQIEMEQFKKDAFGQIEKNIEQFAILGDHLRNPLTVIIGLCDILEDRTIAAKILARAKEIDELITRIDLGWIESEKVRNIIKKYYDIGATGTHELVARAIHEEYIRQQRECGETPDFNSSMVSWNELPYRLRQSNLRQADDIWKKLHLIGCAIALSIGGNEPVFMFTEPEIEYLAMKEHERWVDERKKKGWVHGKTRNDQERIHDCIIPWERLPEYEREKDRNAIRALPHILKTVHLRIIRLEKS